MLTETDVATCRLQSRCIEAIEKQLDTFQKGVEPLVLSSPAVVGNGVLQIDENQSKALLELYNIEKHSLAIVKFVPASGAATRMFAHLVRFVNEYNPHKDAVKSYFEKSENQSIKTFFEHFDDFAFSTSVHKIIETTYPDYKTMQEGSQCLIIAKTLLDKKGMNFLELPKGLVPFHKYTKYTTTAFEEQLFEAAFYAENKGEVAVHFTFAEKHVSSFKEAYEYIKNRVSKKTKTNFTITYSFQKPETDTIAVTLDNEPLRDAKGNLVFRPAGHGALIENLNEIDADLIFIKNIDNVVSEQYVPAMALSKKIIAGKLLQVQKQCFSYLKQLKNASKDVSVSEIKSFISNDLNNKSNPHSITEIKAILNRPIRVCGVVSNTGAPGGGPFWVKHNHQDSLQIVEKAQIDVSNSIQKNILDHATHFNPVDIVCGIKDFEGNRFNLLDFVDHNSGFITQKTFNGQAIKALELPGLWNGGMAHWHTVFVEVPLSTFNPVKTVNDLLKMEHRPLG